MSAQKPSEPARSAESVAADALEDDSIWALNCEPFEASCDVCAEAPKRIVHVEADTSAYTCDECMRDERVGLAAAAMVLQHAPDQGDWPDHDHFLALAELAVGAYLNARHSDGRITPNEGGESVGS